MASNRNGRCACGLWIAALTASMALPAKAQTLGWSDMDCSQSRLAVAQGFRCRASAPYNPGTGSNATYRFYTASVTTGGGTTYLYLMEGLNERSWIRLSHPLPEQVSQSIPLAQSGRDWSEVRLHAGIGYAMFTAEAGERCVGFRKPGPDRGAGHAWAIIGIHCAPKGQLLSDSDVASGLDSARIR